MRESFLRRETRLLCCILNLSKTPSSIFAHISSKVDFTFISKEVRWTYKCHGKHDKSCRPGLLEVRVISTSILLVIKYVMGQAVSTYNRKWVMGIMSCSCAGNDDHQDGVGFSRQSQLGDVLSGGFHVDKLFFATICSILARAVHVYRGWLGRLYCSTHKLSAIRKKRTPSRSNHKSCILSNNTAI